MKPNQHFATCKIYSHFQLLPFSLRRARKYRKMLSLKSLATKQSMINKLSSSMEVSSEPWPLQCHQNRGGQGYIFCNVTKTISVKPFLYAQCEMLTQNNSKLSHNWEEFAKKNHGSQAVGSGEERMERHCSSGLRLPLSSAAPIVGWTEPRALLGLFSGVDV